MHLYVPVLVAQLLTAWSAPGTPANAEPKAVSASPAPAASAKPLREIGRIRALSPFCSKIVGHADDAIQTALTNDVRIAFTISHLRTIDLDSSLVKKANGTHDLLKAYTELRAAAVTGEGQVKALRADAETATDADQKAELKKFADALAGALDRQKKMATELSRYVAYLDSHAPIDDTAKAQFLFDIQYAQTAYGNPFNGNPQDYVPSTLSEVGHDAADQLTLQAADVAADEGHAADKVEPAFKTCL